LDVAGSGEDYHISIWLKGWTRRHGPDVSCGRGGGRFWLRFNQSTPWQPHDSRAFSGEVDTGSPQENATNARNLEHDPIPKERIVL
jgi:hypothetical protein